MTLMRQHPSQNRFSHLFSPFRPSSFARLLGLGLLCAGSHSAYAANQTWSGTTNGNWVTTTNWAAGVVPGSTVSLVNTDTATFNNAGNGNTTLTIDPSRNLRSLI